MTLRLADISARIESIEQLGAVVNAMRGIAAARAQQARGQLGAVDSYAKIIAEGIGRALSLMPPHTGCAPASPSASGKPALVLFAAEQGFAGAFSDHVFDFLGPDLAGSTLFVVGTRGGTVLQERGITPDWSGALPSHSAGIAKLADTISEVLYPRIASGEVARLEVVFAQVLPGQAPQVHRTALLPLDMSSFPNAVQANPPMLNLAPPVLLACLAADYLHAQLCHAALHAFAAENEARMQAMASARDQIGRQLETLRAKERQVRQEDITAELIELAAGTQASNA